MKSRKSFIIVILVSTCITGYSVEPGESLWETNYEAALARAKNEQKTIMLYFAGSDWCKPCILMKKDVFDTESFQQFARNKLVAVKLDFPRLKKNRLPEDQMQQNETLARKYNHEGAFPFIVFLDTNEHVIGKSGYRSGGPDEYINFVEGILANKNN